MDGWKREAPNKERRTAGFNLSIALWIELASRSSFRLYHTNFLRQIGYTLTKTPLPLLNEIFTKTTV